MLVHRLVPLVLAASSVVGLACSEPAPEPPEAARAPAQPTTPAQPRTDAERARVMSGRLYVPAHSHVYTEDGTPADLAVTLSIHNVSTDRELVLDAVRYYDTTGVLLQDYLGAPVVLAPLQTAEYFVEKKDRRGGSGANFVVGWHADSPVVQPLVEAVMVRTEGSQAYAFTSRGIEIRSDTELPRAPDADADGTGTKAE